MAKARAKAKLTKPLRVHIECETPRGYLWMRQTIGDGLPPIGAIGPNNEMVVYRQDRFRDMLDAARCKIVETLAGARRRPRR